MNIGSYSGQSLPTLTVVIPNRNHGHLIGDQLRAIFSQSIQPKRIIVVDDASTDDSVSVIQRLISMRPNAELICKKENSGVIAVINKAMQLADTEYITFPAADDIVLQGFVETSLRLLARYPEAAICSAVSLAQYHGKEHPVPGRVGYPSSIPAYLTPERVRDKLLRSEAWFIGTTAVYRVKPLIAAGGFDPELRSYADDFMCRVLALRHGACFIPELLAINRQSDQSYSRSTTRDDGKARQILNTANARMTTDFRDLFPAELVARSNSRLLFRMLCTGLDNFEAHIRAALDTASIINGRAALLVIFRWATRILKLLLFCVLRFRDIPRVALSKLWQWR